MKFNKTLILLLALNGLAACVPGNDICAGWKPVQVSEETLDHLAKNDPKTLEEITAHNEFGKKYKCW